jgi:RHS repeat-associated protein
VSPTTGDAYVYNGSTWSSGTSVASGLDAVSCTSSRFCVALNNSPGNAYVYKGPVGAQYTTTYNYNDYEELASEIGPLGRTTTYSYDPAGNVITVMDPAGYYTSNAYDWLDRLCATEQTYGFASTPSCSTWQSGETQNTYLDNTTAPLQTTDQNGHTTTYAYADPDYDTSATTVIDAMGNVTSSVYDVAGNLCLTGVGNLWSGSSPPSCSWQQGFTATQYDPAGRKLQSTDQNDDITTYAYTNSYYPDQPTQMTLPGEAPSSATYNADGQVATSTDANNTTTTYGYNQRGELCWQAPTTSSGTCSSPPQVPGLQTFTYFNSEALASSTNASGGGTKTATYTYDAQQKLLSNTDENGNTVSYSYDPAGDVTCVGYPITLGGSSANCANTPSATNAVVDYSYDNDGRITSESDWLGNSLSSTYTTNTQQSVSPSELTNVGYNCAGTSCTSGFANGSVGYGYDPVGNLTSETATGLGANYSLSRSWTYNADDLVATGPMGTMSYNSQKQLTAGGYQYLANGEITSRTDGTSTDTYSYGAGLELSSVTDNTSPASVTSFGYTADGQRCWMASGSASGTCSSAPAGATLYSWSQSGSLCTVGSAAGSGSCPTGQTPTSGDTSYTYGTDGLRTTETSSSGTTVDFTYNTASRSGQPLLLTDGTYAYVYGPDNFGPATPPLEEISLSTGQATAIVSDTSGPAATVTSAGALGTYSYTLYGQRTTSGASVNFGFQGAYQDPDGLLYMIDRYYDPAVGQFISVDPDVGETGQLYAFTGDDPVNKTDPMGLKAKKKQTKNVPKAAPKAAPKVSKASHSNAATEHVPAAKPPAPKHAPAIYGPPAPAKGPVIPPTSTKSSSVNPLQTFFGLYNQTTASAGNGSSGPSLSSQVSNAVENGEAVYHAADTAASPFSFSDIADQARLQFGEVSQLAQGAWQLAQGAWSDAAFLAG